MSADSCSGLASISELLAQASAGTLNIADEVAKCPDVCALAWGSGNPDLSGVGANASYILQTILTFLCGIILCAVYELRGSRYLNLSDRTQKHISNIHNAFLDINAQFSIPVAIAAVIRFHQNAPFYELAFLRALTTMQFMSLLSTAVTSGLFKGDYRRGTKRIVVIVLYGILEFGFYIGLIAGLIRNQSSWTTINDLSNACSAYGHIFPWIKQLPLAHVHLPKISAKDFFNPASKSGWKFGLIITGFVIAGMLALALACFVVPAVFYGLYMILSGQEDWRYLNLPVSLAFAIAMLVELVELERLRNIMKAVAGEDFQDNEWGFGQVIALFLWMPLIIQYFYSISRFSSNPKPPVVVSQPRTTAESPSEKADEKREEIANDPDTKLEDTTKSDEKADGKEKSTDELADMPSLPAAHTAEVV